MFVSCCAVLEEDPADRGPAEAGTDRRAGFALGRRAGFTAVRLAELFPTLDRLAGLRVDLFGFRDGIGRLAGACPATRRARIHADTARRHRRAEVLHSYPKWG